MSPGVNYPTDPASWLESAGPSLERVWQDSLMRSGLGSTLPKSLPTILYPARGYSSAARMMKPFVGASPIFYWLTYDEHGSPSLKLRSDTPRMPGGNFVSYINPSFDISSVQPGGTVRSKSPSGSTRRRTFLSDSRSLMKWMRSLLSRVRSSTSTSGTES